MVLNQHRHAAFAEYTDRMRDSYPILYGAGGDIGEPRDRSQNYKIRNLAESYRKHCRAYYRKFDGTETSAARRVRGALRYLEKDFGDLSPSEFSPLMLKQLQLTMIDADLARTTINHYCHEVKRFFKWGVSEERVHPLTYQALMTVESLKAGRSNARETDPVGPVPQEDIRALKNYLSPLFWDLVCLQIATAARGGEIISLRGMDIEQRGRVWRAELVHHKNAFRGKKRTIYFGGRAQVILKPILCQTRPSDYIFSNDAGLTSYTTGSYRDAVVAACGRAGICRWTPHRLRHTSATLVREKFGVEAAQTYLGQSTLSAAQIYAEKDEKLATKIAEEIG